MVDRDARFDPTAGPPSAESPVADILVVDDTIESLKLLTEILSAAGYQVRPAERPQLALQSALAHPPTLILLDVRMPHMNGFELCRRLKADDRTSKIPVIFVSALQDTDDKVEGFEAGGVDFISKPFEESEVLARVRTHLQLCMVQQYLAERVVERTAELIQANVDLKAEIAVREAAELALKGERVFTDNLIETANVLIIGLDETGAVQLFNPAAERATGYTKEELDGKNWFEVLVPKETYPDVWQMFEQISAEGVTVHFENPILTRGGEERIITWSNNPTGIGAKFAGTVSFGIDITERRQAEKAVLVYQDRLKALAAELTLSEERERRRIATHLHDEVGQALAFARIQIATARKAQSEQRRDSLLDDASQTLLESIRVTRNLVYDLSSPLLSELGLEAAISQWAETEIKERHNLDVQVFDDGHEKPLSEDVEALLFRNVRELLINVAKHAHATSVIVRVERVGDRVRISVQDDGQGMDADPTTQTVTGAGGFGLFSIQERMSDLGGSLEIISESGEGCTMILGAPLAIGQPSRECAT